MYNPLAAISDQLIEVMLQSPKLFVREYYPRGLAFEDAPGTIPLLLTYYEKDQPTEVSRAHFHFKQLEQDRYRFLYDSENVAHQARLRRATHCGTTYKIFINLLPHQWEPPDFLKKKIHTYMQHHLPWWNYSKSNSLHVHLRDRYGKLFLELSWKANQAEVLLDEVENFRPCVTT